LFENQFDCYMNAQSAKSKHTIARLLNGMQLAV